MSDFDPKFGPAGYKAVESPARCLGCAFLDRVSCKDIPCTPAERPDGVNVVFVRDSGVMAELVKEGLEYCGDQAMFEDEEQRLYLLKLFEAMKKEMEKV